MVRGGKGLQGLFVLGNESSRERIDLRTNVPSIIRQNHCCCRAKRKSRFYKPNQIWTFPFFTFHIEFIKITVNLHGGILRSLPAVSVDPFPPTPCIEVTAQHCVLPASGSALIGRGQKYPYWLTAGDIGSQSVVRQTVTRLRHIPSSNYSPQHDIQSNCRRALTNGICVDLLKTVNITMRFVFSLTGFIRRPTRDTWRRAVERLSVCLSVSSSYRQLLLNTDSTVKADLDVGWIHIWIRVGFV